MKVEQSLEEFLEFWAANKSPDRAGGMYRAYASTVAGLADLKKQTAEFLVPVKSGKSIVVGFDPDHEQEVSNLVEMIEKRKQAIQSIAGDISAFMAITSRPTMESLSSEARFARNRIARGEEELKMNLRALSNSNPNLTPLDIGRLPEAIKLSQDFEKIRAESNEELAQIKAKVDAATRIFAKYMG